MQKVMIIGCCGAGKSTFAKKLEKITNLPLIHLDHEYWNPGWVETEKSIWESRVSALSQRPKWIMDGNYGGTMDIRIPAADTIVLLKCSTLKCLYRVIKRTWKYHGRVRPDMVDGCKERFDFSFLHYVAVFNLTRMPALEKKLKSLHADKTLHICNNDAEVNALLEYFKNQKNLLP